VSAVARKRYQSVEAAIITAKSREPAGERATPQKVPELLFDEPRQALSLAQTRGLHAEGLEVIAHVMCQIADRRDGRRTSPNTSNRPIAEEVSLGPPVVARHNYCAAHCHGLSLELVAPESQISRFVRGTR
jgi:hypothetical protein